VDPELHHELRPRGLEHYRSEAKALLRAAQGGEAKASERAGAALGGRFRERFVLADALHVLAVEHGHRSWPAFKRTLEAEEAVAVRGVGRIGAWPPDTYSDWAGRLLAAARRGDAAATERLRARVPRLEGEDNAAIAQRATEADARVCLAREYGFRTWAELADAAERAHRTHYSMLPPESPWKLAEAAVQAGDAERLRRLIDEHPALEHEDPGMTLLNAATQPEAGHVPREVVDVLVEAGSELDVPLNLAACFNKADMVSWLLDAGADAAATPIWGITPLETAAYHGSREAADVLVARTGVRPNALYTAAAAGDLTLLESWFDESGSLRREALGRRPNLSDVGWPPQAPPGDDPADVLAEALSLAAHLGRTRACEALLAHGADPARAPLYGVTALHFAASMNRRETAELLVRHGAPLDARDSLHDGRPIDWARHHAQAPEDLLRLLEPVG
jgi:hypothetical protein